MRRIGYLYDEVISINNLYLAEKKARIGKKNKKDEPGEKDSRTARE